MKSQLSLITNLINNRKTIILIDRIINIISSQCSSIKTITISIWNLPTALKIIQTKTTGNKTTPVAAITIIIDRTTIAIIIIIVTIATPILTSLLSIEDSIKPIAAATTPEIVVWNHLHPLDHSILIKAIVVVEIIIILTIVIVVEIKEVVIILIEEEINTTIVVVMGKGKRQVIIITIEETISSTITITIATIILKTANANELVTLS
mmetsp:Transcript_46913/g.63641  ORF Transcript_46913/g.63641 Transcript_46913/m.63641 type:complete len:208 (+) Transcript_46913:1123-1746(+)